MLEDDEARELREVNAALDSLASAGEIKDDYYNTTWCLVMKLTGRRCKLRYVGRPAGVKYTGAYWHVERLHRTAS